MSKSKYRNNHNSRADVFRDAIASVGTALGTAVAKTKKKKKTNLASEFASSMLTAAMKPPVSFTKSFSSRIGTSKGATTTIPFDLATLLVVTSAGGTPFFESGTSGAYVANLDPNSNISSFPLFGVLGPISAHYMRYRWKKFNIAYEPTCATSTNGVIGFCVYNDPAISNQNIGLVNCGGSDGGVILPPWKPTPIPSHHVSREWKYIRDDLSSPSVADKRFEEAGILCLASGAASGLPGSTIIGVVRFTGEIELAEIAATYTVALAKNQPIKTDDESKEQEPDGVLVSKQ